MKNLTTLALAGVLFACVGATDSALAQNQCAEGACIVNISVNSRGQVEAQPETLRITGNAPVVIQFRLQTAGYSFLENAAQSIAFKSDDGKPRRGPSAERAQDHFTVPAHDPVGGQKVIVLVDFNNPHNGEAFSYNVTVQDADGATKSIDPELIND